MKYNPQHKVLHIVIVLHLLAGPHIVDLTLQTSVVLLGVAHLANPHRRKVGHIPGVHVLNHQRDRVLVERRHVVHDQVVRARPGHDDAHQPEQPLREVVLVVRDVPEPGQRTVAAVVHEDPEPVPAQAL